MTRAQTSSPLLNRSAQSPIARLTQPLNQLPLTKPYLEVSQTQFINHVLRLAQALPAHQYVVNLCDNRYLFLVSLCAVIVNQGTILLPPNKKCSTQLKLITRYEDCIVLHDGQIEVIDKSTSDIGNAPTNPTVDISLLDWSLDSTQVDTPQIKLDHLAVISFTSGSTGESKPNLKYWRTLVTSSTINAAYMLIDSTVNHSHIATVPGQHMWGFETSVLLALFSDVALVDARPFFASDIVSLIKRLPTPTTLISAPLHLKTLSEALKNKPETSIQLASILCATAPLDHKLAQQLEAQFGCKLKEVYGCSEVGSMAIRNTAQNDAWQPFSGLNFDHDAQATRVSAAHLPLKITLEDTLQFDDQGRFTLQGRQSDQIKIAGKRGSLAEVNAVLNRFEGLRDGVVIFPPQDRNVPRLVALVRLKPGVTKAELRQFMSEQLDSAFVPRPILEVENLPREDNGKLRKAETLRLYQSLRSP